MKAPWGEVRFEELYLVPSRNGLNRPSAVRGEGHKMINMGEVFAHDRIFDINMERVKLNDKEKGTHRVLPGDLMFARQSIVAEGAGKCSIVLEASEMTCFESHIIRVRLDDRFAVPIFYFYFFQSALGKAFLSTIRQQGVQAGIRGSDLAKSKLPYPPIPNQQKIARILSAYDALIENNLKRIRLLEEMARITYEQWFVRMQFPGHETTPTDPETGLPEGWGDMSLGEACMVSGGGTPSKDIGEYWEKGDVTWFSPTDLSKAGSLVLLDSSQKITEKGLAKSSAKLMGTDSFMMTSRATIGLFGLIRKPFSTNQGFINVTPHDLSHKYFLLYNFKSRVPEFYNHASGATFPEISKAKFKRLKIWWPTEALLCEWHEFASPIIDMLFNLAEQNQRLRESRDILLPRLMTGMIDVDDLELPEMPDTEVA